MDPILGTFVVLFGLAILFMVLRTIILGKRENRELTHDLSKARKTNNFFHKHLGKEVVEPVVIRVLKAAAAKVQKADVQRKILVLDGIKGQMIHYPNSDPLYVFDTKREARDDEFEHAESEFFQLYDWIMEFAESFGIKLEKRDWEAYVGESSECVPVLFIPRHIPNDPAENQPDPDYAL